MPLGNEFVWNRGQSNRFFKFLNKVRLLRLFRLALQTDPLSLFLRLLQQSLIFLYAAQKIFAALGVVDVLNAHIDPLSKDFASYAFVYYYTNGVLSHIEYAPGFAMICLIGQTLLYSTMSLNVNDVADLENPHVCGQRNNSMLSEGTGKHVPCAATIAL